MKTEKQIVEIMGENGSTGLKAERVLVTELNEKDLGMGKQKITKGVETEVGTYTVYSIYKMTGKYTLKVTLPKSLKGYIGSVSLYQRTGLQGYQKRILAKEFSELNSEIEFLMNIEPGDNLAFRITSPKEIADKEIKVKIKLIDRSYSAENETFQECIDGVTKTWEYSGDVVILDYIYGKRSERDVWRYEIPYGYMVKISKIIGANHKVNTNIFYRTGSTIVIKNGLKNFAIVGKVWLQRC